MRLIDADNLGVKKLSDFRETTTFAYGWNSALNAVKNDSPSIDPQTLPIVKELREKLEKMKTQLDAAIDELGGVLATVDVLTDFVDDEVYPVVNYDLYLELREKVDTVTTWEHENKWRGPVTESEEKSNDRP